MIILKNKFKKNIKNINLYFKETAFECLSELKDIDNYSYFYSAIKSDFFDDLYLFVNSLLLFPTTNNVKLKFSKNLYFNIFKIILNISQMLTNNAYNDYLKINFSKSTFNFDNQFDFKDFNDYQINYVQLNLYIIELSILINKLLNNYYKFDDLYIMIASFINFKFLKLIKNSNETIDGILYNFNNLMSRIKKYYNFFFNEFTYIINS